MTEGSGAEEEVRSPSSAAEVIVGSLADSLTVVVEPSPSSEVADVGVDSSEAALVLGSTKVTDAVV